MRSPSGHGAHGIPGSPPEAIRAEGDLVFDGDEAGQKATMRAVEMLERQDLIAEVVELPNGRTRRISFRTGRSASSEG